MQEECDGELYEDRVDEVTSAAPQQRVASGGKRRRASKKKHRQRETCGCRNVVVLHPLAAKKLNAGKSDQRTTSCMVGSVFCQLDLII